MCPECRKKVEEDERKAGIDSALHTVVWWFIDDKFYVQQYMYSVTVYVLFDLEQWYVIPIIRSCD